jgi:hypothetical protein
MKRRINLKSWRVGAAEVFFHRRDGGRCRTERDISDRIDDLVVENDAAYFEPLAEPIYSDSSFASA